MAVKKHSEFLRGKVTQDIDPREDLSWWLVMCGYWQGVLNERKING